MQPRWSPRPPLTLAPIPSLAQESRGPPIIRDAEIEQLLRDYTAPLLRVAGLTKQNVQVVIINETTFNAFVIDGRRIFVNSGALMDSQTPNQIIGVLAHETGHIAGGHLAKLREQLARAQTQAILATILGVGAMVAGATTNRNSNNGLGSAGAAALSAPQEVIRRNILSYQRQQEENADRSAVRYLNETGQSPKGMYETFRRFSEQILFVARNADPYAQSHPMPAERVAALAEFASTSPYWDKKDDTVAATAPRPDARKNLRLHGAARHGAAPLSDVERQPAGALCPRHRRLQARRPAQRRRPDRRAVAGAAQQSVLPRIARPGAARRRAAERGDRAAAKGACSSPTTRR